MNRIVITLLITLFCGGSVAHAGDVLLKAAKAITLDGPSIEPVAILVHDGKIKQISQTIEVSDDVKVVDLGDVVVVPGFVNAYSQLGITGGSSEFTREITPNFDVQTAIDWESRGFREALDAGVTTVGISPGTENVIAGISLAAKTTGSNFAQRIVKQDTGLVITLASDPRNRNRARSRPDSIYLRQPTNRMGVVWMLRSTMQDSATKAGSADVVAEALSGNRRIFCVSRTHFDIETVLRVAEEFDFSPVIVGGEESYQLAAVLAEKKLAVILGPLRTTLSSGAEGTDPAWNRAGVLHKAGVVIAMSGDDLLEQARFAVRFGLPEETALRAITIEPAKLLGIEQRVGSLAVGRDADLVVLNGDPFEFTTNVQAVIVDGMLIDAEDKKE